MSGKFERKRRACEPPVGKVGSMPGSPEVKNGDKESSRIHQRCQVRDEESILAFVGELRGSTMVVLGLSLILGVFLFVVDLILSRIINVVL